MLYQWKACLPAFKRHHIGKENSFLYRQSIRAKLRQKHFKLQEKSHNITGIKSEYCENKVIVLQELQE